jgi:hypothetical protein
MAVVYWDPLTLGSRNTTGGHVVRETVEVSDSMPKAITATLLPEATYEVGWDAIGLVISDERSRPVARLPPAVGGEVDSHFGRWRIAAERRGKGWVVIARDVAAAEPAASARTRWWPSRYSIEVRQDGEYRLGQHPLSGAWALRKGPQQVARFSAGVPDRIETAEALVPSAEFTLAVLLSYETIRYERAIPFAALGGGGP